jgi:hypothetical protein
MTERFLFSDEAGCFTFNKNQNVSRYFIICTVTASDLDLALALTRLRHTLIREGLPVGDYFHATTDAQAVRDRVFSTMLDHPFKFQATICEKSKAQPQVRSSKARFYQYPWFYHLKHGISPHVNKGDTLMVTAASIGSKKERHTYTNCLKDVLNQNVKDGDWAVDFRPAGHEPLLQVADYCAWAVQRKWERGDLQSFDLIKHRLTYEYELWKKGTVHYY